MLSKGKILHLSKYFYPESGGIENVVKTLAEGCAERGFSVEVVCFKSGGESPEPSIESYKVIRCSSWNLFSQPVSFRYIFTALRRARLSNLLHVHLPNYFAIVVAVLAAVFFKAKVVLHWHSDVIGKGGLSACLRPLELLALHCADAVIVTSESYLNASPLLSKFKWKCEVVPIGVRPVAAFDGPVGTFNPLNYDIVSSQFVLSVGRLVDYKNFRCIVAAGKLLKCKSKIVIVGDGPLRSSLEAQIVRSDLSSKIILTGRIDERALHWLFSNASIFALASNSRAEAFGVVLVEAMSFGLPIVATNIPGSGVPWVNAHGISGLNVEPDNPSQLASAMDSILLSNRFRERLSRGARARFHDLFTQNQFIRSVCMLYRRLLD